jgi:hypothetical protein
VRLALGAGRFRVVRQMLVESLLLAALGGVGGLLAGYLGSIAIPKMTENAWERFDFHVHFDWKIFGFTAALTLATGLLFGIAPALAAARAEVTSGLKETAHTTTRRRKGMASKALVAFQIALSTLLVISAGLFLRTGINPPRRNYPPGKDVELHRRIEQSFAVIPGVKAVSVVAVPYVSDDSDRSSFVVEGENVKGDDSQGEYNNIVGTRFFETMGVPILAGRALMRGIPQPRPRLASLTRPWRGPAFPDRIRSASDLQ